MLRFFSQLATGYVGLFEKNIFIGLGVTLTAFCVVCAGLGGLYSLTPQYQQSATATAVAKVASETRIALETANAPTPSKVSPTKTNSSPPTKTAVPTVDVTATTIAQIFARATKTAAAPAAPEIAPTATAAGINIPATAAPQSTAASDPNLAQAIELVRGYLTRGHNEKDPERVDAKLAEYNVAWSAERTALGYLVKAIFPAGTHDSALGDLKVALWCVRAEQPYYLNFTALQFSASGRFETTYPSMPSMEDKECGVNVMQLEQSITPLPVTATSNNAGGGKFDGPVGVCTTGCSVSTPPPGCLIKGNVNSDNEKIYHLEGDRDYKKVQIKPEEGDRWFCAEAEARAAGFRHAQQSPN